MIKIFKPKLAFVILLSAVLLLSCLYANIVSVQISKFNGTTIVLDAGHGGRDGGSVGDNGTIEKTINLEYTLALKEKLVKAGYKVELTRKTDDGLYSNAAPNKKQSDMNARFKIIEKTNPNLIVSIHMNSFRDHSAHGATTYYRKGDKASMTVANLIQQSLNTYCDAPSSTAKVGDYYILNCSYYSAVLIECGFLSNAEEESMLNSTEYKNKIVDAIFSAILLYFG